MKSFIALTNLVFFGHHLVSGLALAGWDAVIIGALLVILYLVWPPKSAPTELEK